MQSTHVVHCCNLWLLLGLYKIFTIHNDICGYFLKISGHFPKVIPNFLQRPDKCFWTFSEVFWTLSKDNKRLLEMAEEYLYFSLGSQCFNFSKLKKTGCELGWCRTDRLWLTLHPCCHQIQTTGWFICEVTIIVQFSIHNWVHVSVQTEQYCNLLNETSHDLNWVGKRM